MFSYFVLTIELLIILTYPNKMALLKENILLDVTRILLTHMHIPSGMMMFCMHIT